MIAETAPMKEQQAEAAAEQADETADTVADALAPVLGWEQSNVEFWVQVAQLIVLLLILRRIS